MKKFLALALSVAMCLSLLAGCGSSSDDTSDEDTETTETESTDEESSDDEEESTDEESSDDEDSSSSSDGDTSVVVGYVGTHYACYPSSSTSSDFICQAMVYDKLFEVDDSTGEYTSRVLESWEWTDDQTLVMTLKDGIYFSDGNQMTMEDVLFSLEDYITQGESTDKYTYYQYIDFDSCEISDDGMTLTLVWQDTYGPAERELNCSIMEKEFTEEHDSSDEIWYTGPVGSGPYEITECVQDSYVVFTLREDYWNTDYSYDATEITLKFYTDENAMFMDYQAGNIDVMYDVGTTVVSQVEEDSSLGTVEYVSTNDVSFIILNEDNEYLSDIAVREAIAYALDMDYITEVAYGLLGTTAYSHYASTFECYEEHEGYTYDADYALEVLEEAGYSEGEISLSWLSPDSSPQPEIGEAVQALLSMIGIDVEVETYELATTLSMYIEGEGDIMMMTVTGGNPTMEPYQCLSAFMGGATFTSMSIEDETYNSYLDAGLDTVDEEERWEAYRQADDWLYENFNAIPICETTSAIVYNDRISSFDQSTVGRSCLGSLKLA